MKEQLRVPITRALLAAMIGLFAVAVCERLTRASTGSALAIVG